MAFDELHSFHSGGGDGRKHSPKVLRAALDTMMKKATEMVDAYAERTGCCPWCLASAFGVTWMAMAEASLSEDERAEFRLARSRALDVAVAEALAVRASMRDFDDHKD
jgi:hypothetical protein